MERRCSGRYLFQYNINLGLICNNKLKHVTMLDLNKCKISEYHKCKGENAKNKTYLTIFSLCFIMKWLPFMTLKHFAIRNRNHFYFKTENFHPRPFSELLPVLKVTPPIIPVGQFRLLMVLLLLLVLW